MTEKRLLLTCFEPFGGSERNASQEAVAAMPDRIGAYTVDKLCLPTVFGLAAERAIAAAGELDPDVVIAVGEAGGRSAITPEKAAVNLQDARIPDNMGQRPKGQAVIAGGEETLFSTLPHARMIQAIREAGLPADLSLSAGSFVCNDLMYRLLHHFRGTNVRCGFIHVPAGDALQVDELVRGLTAAIMALDETEEARARRETE